MYASDVNFQTTEHFGAEVATVVLTHERFFVWMDFGVTFKQTLFVESFVTFLAFERFFLIWCMSFWTRGMVITNNIWLQTKCEVTWYLFQVQFFMLFHMVALLTAHFKDSSRLLKKINQSENGWKSYHGKQNQGCHVKEHKKLIQKLVSKMTLHFVWGHLSKKQTVPRSMTAI